MNTNRGKNPTDESSRKKIAHIAPVKVSPQSMTWDASWGRKTGPDTAESEKLEERAKRFSAHLSNPAEQRKERLEVEDLRTKMSRRRRAEPDYDELPDEEDDAERAQDVLSRVEERIRRRKESSRRSEKIIVTVLSGVSSEADDPYDHLRRSSSRGREDIDRKRRRHGSGSSEGRDRERLRDEQRRDPLPHPQGRYDRDHYDDHLDQNRHHLDDHCSRDYYTQHEFEPQGPHLDYMDDRVSIESIGRYRDHVTTQFSPDRDRTRHPGQEASRDYPGRRHLGTDRHKESYHRETSEDRLHHEIRDLYSEPLDDRVHSQDICREEPRDRLRIDPYPDQLNTRSRPLLGFVSEERHAYDDSNRVLDRDLYQEEYHPSYSDVSADHFTGVSNLPSPTDRTTDPSDPSQEGRLVIDYGHVGIQTGDLPKDRPPVSDYPPTDHVWRDSYYHHPTDRDCGSQSQEPVDSYSFSSQCESDSSRLSRNDYTGRDRHSGRSSSQGRNLERDYFKHGRHTEHHGCHGDSDYLSPSAVVYPHEDYSDRGCSPLRGCSSDPYSADRAYCGYQDRQDHSHQDYSRVQDHDLSHVQDRQDSSRHSERPISSSLGKKDSNESSSRGSDCRWTDRRKSNSQSRHPNKKSRRSRERERLRHR